MIAGAVVLPNEALHPKNGLAQAVGQSLGHQQQLAEMSRPHVAAVEASQVVESEGMQ